MTRGSRVSFADFVRDLKGGAAPHEDFQRAGAVNYFISHSWSNPYKLIVDMVERHCPPENRQNTYYWVCTYANDQHHFTTAGVGMEDQSFAKAINAESFRGIIAVQKDLPGQMPLITIGRAWCAFEIAYAIVKKKEYSFVCNDNIIPMKIGATLVGKCSEQLLALMKNWEFNSDAKCGVTQAQDKVDINDWCNLNKEGIVNGLLPLAYAKKEKINQPWQAIEHVLKQWADPKGITRVLSSAPYWQKVSPLEVEGPVRDSTLIA